MTCQDCKVELHTPMDKAPLDLALTWAHQGTEGPRRETGRSVGMRVISDRDLGRLVKDLAAIAMCIAVFSLLYFLVSLIR